MTKLYLAGPMTGLVEFNFPAFDRAAAKLRAAGYEVFSPAEHDRENGFNEKGLDGFSYPEGFDLRKTLMADLQWIADNADGIALLSHWEHSKGTITEISLAAALSLPVKPVGLWLIGAELSKRAETEVQFA